jgi:opacity protein-like surface antigen
VSRAIDIVGRRTCCPRFSSADGRLAGALSTHFAQNLSVKLEYDYLRFGQITELPATAGGLGVTLAVVKLDMQTLFIGLNYRFY